MFRTLITRENTSWSRLKSDWTSRRQFHKLVEHDWVFHPYTAGTQMHILLDKAKKLALGIICLMADQHVPLQVIHFIDIIMRSGQNSMKGETQTQPEWISHRVERLGSDA